MSPVRSRSEHETAPHPITAGAPDALREIRGRLLGGVGLATWAVLLISLAALVPTVGDFGLTWDEPAYRYSQMLSAQWWEQLSNVRSWR